MGDKDLLQNLTCHTDDVGLVSAEISFLQECLLLLVQVAINSVLQRWHLTLKNAVGVQVHLHRNFLAELFPVVLLVENDVEKPV